VQATTTRPKIIVTVDGVGVVSHAGSRLLANCATTISEIAVLADQAAFGVIRVGGVGLDMLAAARPTRRHRAGCDRGGAGGVPVGRALPAFRSCSARAGRHAAKRGRCAAATQARTPPPTTSRFSTRRWRRSPTPTRMAESGHARG
jgi:hypothetical protein